MWNITERTTSNHAYTQSNVNNWHLGKERNRKRFNPWREDWRVLVDVEKLFIAHFPATGPTDFVDGFWIAWRD